MLNSPSGRPSKGRFKNEVASPSGDFRCSFPGMGGEERKRIYYY